MKINHGLNASLNKDLDKITKDRQETLELNKKADSKEGIKSISSKLSDIKDRIQNGDYKINLAQTSNKMALNLLNL